MSLLQGLNTSEEVTPESDSLGGGGPWDSGLYKVRVVMAYLQKAASGALALNLHLADENNRELRQTIYVSSGDAKGNKTYYENAQGEKRNLPGFSLFRSLTLMTLNKEPTAITTEDKVIKVYSREAKAEVPTTVPVIVDLLDQEIIAGVVRQVEDRNVKDDNGNYVPSGETRETNEIDKFFHAGTRMTLAEAMAGETEGKFIDGWESKFAGTVRDKTSASKGAANGAPAAAQSNVFAQKAAAASTPKPTASLFG